MSSHSYQRGPGNRPPVKSLKEFAAEFGVKTHSLRQAIKNYGGPPVTLYATKTEQGISPSGESKSQRTTAAHYEVAKMRAWWAIISEKLKGKDK